MYIGILQNESTWQAETHKRAFEIFCSNSRFASLRPGYSSLSCITLMFQILHRYGYLRTVTLIAGRTPKSYGLYDFFISIYDIIGIGLMHLNIKNGHRK